MEKISRILSPSPRITSVDLQEAGPVRPGTPGFGRAEGVSSLKMRQQEAAEAAANSARMAHQLVNTPMPLGVKSAGDDESFGLMMDSGEGQSVVMAGSDVQGGYEAQEESSSRSSSASLASSGLYPKGSFYSKYV